MSVATLGEVTLADIADAMKSDDPNERDASRAVLQYLQDAEKGTNMIARNTRMGARTTHNVSLRLAPPAPKVSALIRAKRGVPEPEAAPTHLETNVNGVPNPPCLASVIRRLREKGQTR